MEVKLNKTAEDMSREVKSKFHHSEELNKREVVYQQQLSDHQKHIVKLEEQLKQMQKQAIHQHNSHSFKSLNHEGSQSSIKHV